MQPAPKKSTPIQRLTYENYMLQLNCNELNQTINRLQSQLNELNKYIDTSCNCSDINPVTTNMISAIVSKPPKPIVKDESKCFPYGRYGYPYLLSDLLFNDYSYYRDMSHNPTTHHKELPPSHPIDLSYNHNRSHPYQSYYVPPYYFPPDYLPYYPPDYIPYYLSYHPLYIPYYSIFDPTNSIISEYQQIYYNAIRDMSNCLSADAPRPHPVPSDESRGFHHHHHRRQHHHPWRDINSLPTAPIHNPPHKKELESDNSPEVIQFLQNKNIELQKIIMDQHKIINTSQ